jgi:predicted nucleic acid-binding protein
MLKIVVDSSIWIDFFNKKTNPKTEYLKYLLLNIRWSSPVIILPIIIQEVLQGIEDDKNYVIIRENLQGLDFLHYDPYKFSISAADLYRSLRKKGITIRKANDCLIAAICIANDIPLLHNDKDFDNIAKYTSLKIYKTEK